MSRTLTIWPGFVPEGYFDDDNVKFIQEAISDELDKDFRQRVVVDRASIIRKMEAVLSEMIESVPKMNRRVIMIVVSHFRQHQLETNKHLKWEAHYTESQRLYDPTTERGPDMQRIKLSQRLGQQNVGSTTRFFFT